MNIARYHVGAIFPGRRKGYYDFWTRDVKVNLQGEELHPGMLAITIEVDAKTKADAEHLVQGKFPDHLIDTVATTRLE